MQNQNLDPKITLVTQRKYPSSSSSLEVTHGSKNNIKDLDIFTRQVWIIRINNSRPSSPTLHPFSSLNYTCGFACTSSPPHLFVCTMCLPAGVMCLACICHVLACMCHVLGCMCHVLGLQILAQPVKRLPSVQLYLETFYYIRGTLLPSLVSPSYF